MVARGGKKAPDGHDGQDHSQQRAVKTKGKNTVSAVTEPSDTSLRRPSRGTRGQGGAPAQPKAIEEVQTRPAPPAKRTATQVTRDKQTLNPMAPPVKPKRGRKTTSTQKQPTQELLASPTTEVESRFQEADPGSRPEPADDEVPADNLGDNHILEDQAVHTHGDDHAEMNLDKTLLVTTTFLDVLQEHQRKNGAPRPPDPAVLNKVRRRAARASPELGDISDADIVAQPKPKRARYSKNSPANIVPKPSQGSFYTPQWRDILDRGKAISRCESINHPFPARDVFIRGPGIEYLTEAITEAEEAGVLYEDIDDAEEYADFVKDAVASLLEDGAYLPGGFDEQGHTDNFASVCLFDVINNYFYEGNRPARCSFQRCSKRKYREGQLSWQLKAAIDEYDSGALVQKFLLEIYVPVYDTINGLMNELELNAYPSNKAKNLRQAWAAAAPSAPPILKEASGPRITLFNKVTHPP
ncbi:hypothetical protein BV22DRAFT_1132338 [Leucogyrophana mollusca]|uniref:Uncharacterized protein n=1 Tax=Leucogyrophana mollusca TaxID=85980 RepID=A0ACB8B7H1_9AGAM|nr:hypothetical protein BV22DRAFT_1132338 [Leucogyrophana mollusca]